MGEAALRARIKEYRRDIAALEKKEVVTLADRVTIARMCVHLGGLQEALSIIIPYAEQTRGRQR